MLVKRHGKAMGLGGSVVSSGAKAFGEVALGELK